MIQIILLLLLLSRAIAISPISNIEEEIRQTSDVPHSRQKRLIWVTDDGRLALPPGTTLVIAPTLAMPLIRYPPDGFHSNISVSLPLTIDFDKLGLTDNQNPLGTLGPYFARSLSASAGHVLADYIYKFIKHRSKRQIANINQRENEIRSCPRSIKMVRGVFFQFHLKQTIVYSIAFHGGERVILYALLEDFLSNFGLDGHGCLLRAICEVHQHKKIDRYGLVGEFMKLFFTASLSPYEAFLSDYVKAERTGKDVSECYTYVKRCPKSIFRSSSVSAMNQSM